jgi:hypothetical protein
MGVLVEVDELGFGGVDAERDGGELSLQTLEGGEDLIGGAYHVEVVDECEVLNSAVLSEVDECVVDV